jgi:hypothetical protein
MAELRIEAISGLSSSGRRHCEQLLAAPLEPIELLRTRVEAHRARIESVGQSSQLFDLPLARRIAGVLGELLSEPLDPERHRAVQLAVRYFEKDADADPDFESVLGFEDDALVVNAVVRFVGRDELLIESL